MFQTRCYPTRLFAPCLVGLALVLSACQTPSQPPLAMPTTTPQASLSSDQIEALKGQGFELKGEGWTFDLSSKVLFKRDDAQLTPASRAALERVGKALLDVGIDRLRLEGHTDSQGNAGYNHRLSVARAKSVSRALMAIGMRPENIFVHGWGMSRPVADNRTAAGRAENRRVAIIVAAQ